MAGLGRGGLRGNALGARPKAKISEQFYKIPPLKGSSERSFYETILFVTILILLKPVLEVILYTKYSSRIPSLIQLVAR
jgi:hypothetical protein